MLLLLLKSVPSLFSVFKEKEVCIHQALHAILRRGAWLGVMGGLLSGAVIGVLTKLGGLAIGCMFF